MKKNKLFDELYLSFLECSKNKSSTINAINFLIDKEKKLISLKYDLENRVYVPGKSIYFIVTKPKVREVFAADFRDRIIHHFFIRSIEKEFYNDLTKVSYSCIKGRGTHLSVNNIKKIYSNYRYYLQIDIKSFFMSIDKKILKQKIKQYLPSNFQNHINENLDEKYDFRIYDYLSEIIVDFDPTTNCIYKGNKSLIKLLPKEKSLFNLKKGKGLAIGNYSSQFFANIYLNDLDKYILDLGFKDSFRYVDDLVIFGNDYKKLKELEFKINNYLKSNLSMELAKGKTKLKQTIHGLDFLGFFIKPNCTYVRKRVIHNFIGKIDLMKVQGIYYIDLFSLKKYKKIDLLKSSKIVKIVNFNQEILNNIVQVFSSYVGHFVHANAKNLLRKILYKNSFLQYYFDFDGKKHKFLKNNKFKNINKAYKYYEKLYKNTIIFFPYKEYFIFKSKYLYLLKKIKTSKYIVEYKRIGFKIHKDYYKLILLEFLKIKKFNILVVNKNISKYSLEKLFII